ncbi:hypothetical protein BGY98DRAFT_1113319 [Russula aff. rugulosa BPL654]|nr:hypothetical protein BGY98DRAFT_1113319 [Russula aff. rugulosa BPL654]
MNRDIYLTSDGAPAGFTASIVVSSLKSGLIFRGAYNGRGVQRWSRNYYALRRQKRERECWQSRTQVVLQVQYTYMLQNYKYFSFHTEWHRSLVGWWAPRTPVGEPDVVIGSHEYDGHASAKSIRRKAVERHKQANDVLIMASSLDSTTLHRGYGYETFKRAQRERSGLEELCPSAGFMDSDESIFSHHRTHTASAQALHKDAPEGCQVPKQRSIITKSISTTGVAVRWCNIYE